MGHGLRSRWARVGCVLLTLVLAAGAWGQVTPRFERQERQGDPLLVAPRLMESPVVDGDLSDPAWKSAATVSAFWLGGQRQLAQQQTRAWIGVHEDQLCIAFAAEDASVQAQRYEHDSHAVWKNDAVEVMLYPTQQAGVEYQFIVGAAGATFDRASIAGPKLREQTAWQPAAPWRSAARRTEQGFAVEMVIPLAALGDPRAGMKPGARWGLKLTRLDLGPSDQITLSSWTSIGTSTNDPKAIGTLAFERPTLLSNGGAELADEQGGPRDWQVTTYPELTLRATRTSDDKVEGEFAARYELRGPKVAGKGYRIHMGGQAPPLRSSRETCFRWRARVKVENPDNDLVAYALAFSGDGNQTFKLKHNAGWQQLEAIIVLPADRDLTLPCIQGVALISTSQREQGGGVILIDDVSLEPVDASVLGLLEGEVCLTGNATGAQSSRNARVAGSYTYYEPGTTAAEFPYWWPGRQMQEPGLYQGAIRFDQGRLTDGHTATAVAWGGFWTGPLGHDITFDLGESYEITRVVVHSPRAGGGDALWLRSPGEPRFTLVADRRDQVMFNANVPPPPIGEDGAIVFGDIQQPARWLRLSHRDKDAQPSEVQVWGRPLSAAGTVVRKAYQQGKGVVAVEQPAGEPISYESVAPIFPVPQQLQAHEGQVTLKLGMTILYEPATSERAHVTAQVLAEELKACFGIETQVQPGGAAPTDRPYVLLGLDQQSPLLASTLSQRGATIPAQPDGYVLDVRGEAIVIGGRDDRGAFYGTQALLSLVRRRGEQWVVPAVTVNDWPTLTTRFIQGRPEPSLDLIRALARFRVTHYEPSERFNDVAAKFDAQAQRYFVSFVPSLNPNAIVLRADPNLVERHPNETPDMLGHGRRNPNPGHPKTWEIYFAQCDRLLPRFHGDLVSVNLDEMYIEHMGARWNVSAESRALNLSAGPLLAHFLNKIDARFKQYGKRIVMHDTSFMGHRLSYVGDPDPNWNQALPLIPRDIEFLVWHPKEVNALLGGMGFKLHYLALDEQDWRGMDVTPYAGLTAYMAESAFTASKLLDLVGVAWNPSAPRPYDPRARAAVNRAIQLWNQLHLGVRLPSTIASEDDFTCIDLRSAANDTRVDEVAFDGKGGADLGPNADLRALAAGRQRFAGVPFDIIDESSNRGLSLVKVHNRGYADRTFPSEAAIDLPPQRVASLVFLHCLDNRPGHNYLRRKELAGYYVIEYGDGLYDVKEIQYAVNTANFDGRPVMSGYNPRGHNMTDGSLAWQGESRSGMPVFLYSTEWVNPRPDVPITRVRLRAAHVMGNMNPMLLGLTAVRAGGALGGGKQTSALRPVTTLAPATAVGQLVDLRGGVDESETRYRAPDGTVIESSKLDNLTSDHGESSAAWYRSYVGIVNHDGNQAVRGDTVTYHFAQPRPLTGALVTAAYRIERKTEDFEPAVHDLTLSVSDDGGNTWRQVAAQAGVLPDEVGPVWLGLDGKPVTHVRLRAANRSPALGFSHVQWFEQK
jgi:hypothetical protein